MNGNRYVDVEQSVNIEFLLNDLDLKDICEYIDI